jgi:hypothetical protein
MCKNPKSPYLVGLPKTGSSALVFKSNCDEWECEECAAKKRSQWSARAILGCETIRSNGMDAKFITVTSAEWYTSSAAAIANFPRAWNKLYCRLKRKNPALMYLLTIEFGAKTGHMHAHFLTDAQQTERWYKNNARSSGMGYQAKVETVETSGKAAAYVSKYIGKSLGGHALPRKFRRVRCSQNWTPLVQLEAHRQSSDYDWLVCNTRESLWWATAECQKTRTTMIDGSTGEYFDYGEAVDTWYH